MSSKKKIAIIGGGASAMMLACVLDTSKYDVTIYERNAALGRKLLVAGDGGFNLTHSEEIAILLTRYAPASFLEPCLLSFNNNDFRDWLKAAGVPTFIGTSKRVFPEEGIKPIDVLNVFLNRIRKNKVEIKPNHFWKGWNEEDELLFENDSQQITVSTAIAVFALGGSSWKVTGSDGGWANHFKAKGIATLPFESSNCAVKINWNNEFIAQHEGQSLKNCELKINKKSKKGEVVITKFGMEGGAVYALIGEVRQQLKLNHSAQLFIDLKPELKQEEIEMRLNNRGNKSITQQLSAQLNLNDLQLHLLKSTLTKNEFTNSSSLANCIKNVPVEVLGLAPIDEAISTVGGIALDEVDEQFQLLKMKNHYCIGEMLNWDAPTGGYLLQACFSMGYFLAKKLNETEESK